ncbi:MAG: sulfite exporter TauE/SafE family protein [Burkholderiales bacterium]|nr:sulfite exporter TauE/SafE family protein [Burkholderiales bacterium]
MIPDIQAGAAASLFAAGLLGGVHCVGMCGGIVTALTVRLPGAKPRRDLALAYHAGRITTYAAGGALAGGIGAAILRVAPLALAQAALFVLAQLMLLALGLYLFGVPKYLDVFERAGRTLWRRVAPLASRLLPVRTAPRAYTVGLAWGFLPCGLVYSMLAVALVSGEAASGALAMLAFGAGTLPGLLAFGAVLRALERLRRALLVRRAAGVTIIAFGLLGLARAGEVGAIADSLLRVALLR